MVVPLEVNVCYVDCIPSTRFETQTQSTAGFREHLPPISGDHQEFARKLIASLTHIVPLPEFSYSLDTWARAGCC